MCCAHTQGLRVPRRGEAGGERGGTLKASTAYRVLGVHSSGSGSSRLAVWLSGGASSVVPAAAPRRRGRGGALPPSPSSPLSSPLLFPLSSSEIVAAQRGKPQEGGCARDGGGLRTYSPRARVPGRSSDERATCMRQAAWRRDVATIHGGQRISKSTGMDKSAGASAWVCTSVGRGRRRSTGPVRR